MHESALYLQNKYYRLCIVDIGEMYFTFYEFHCYVLQAITDNWANQSKTWHDFIHNTTVISICESELIRVRTNNELITLTRYYYVILILNFWARPTATRCLLKAEKYSLFIITSVGDLILIQMVFRNSLVVILCSK